MAARSILLWLAACSSSPRSFAAIEAAVANPTGSVNATSAAGMVLDNQTRTAILGAANLIFTNTPSGFRRDTGSAYTQTCSGLSTTVKTTKTLDLSVAQDAGTTGAVVVGIACASDGFSLDVALKSACDSALCLNGELLAQYSATNSTTHTLVWSLLANAEPPGGGVSSVVDMGGTEVFVSSGSAATITDSVVGYFGKPAAPILLTWGGGINAYSQFYLKGTSSYICHLGDSGGSSCDQLGATGALTGAAPITW